MTGLLAVTGIALVLLASAYSGLTSSDAEMSTPGLQITPVTDRQEGEDSIPTPTATPQVAEATPVPTQVTNREDCDVIRGTDYFSPEERTWFLANCVNR